MKKFMWLLIAVICVAVCSCVPNGNDPTEPIIPEGMNCLKDVIFLDESIVDSVSIINDTTIIMCSQIALNDTLKVGRKFVYSHSKTAEGFCLGIVTQVENNAPTYVIHTTIPSFDEIFSELSLIPEFNLTNLQTSFIADESDNVIFKGLVDNSVWDELETIYREDTVEVSSAPTRIGSMSVPIDITLSFEVKPNKAFTGTIYVRLQGRLQIHNFKAYEMDVHQTVGIVGSFSMVEKSTDRKYIPLLQVKNGITIYSNKIVGLRIKPSLNFFYGGGIKLEAGFKYEMINNNIRSVFDGNDLKSFTSENLKDYYFRVKSIHTEGEFGLSLSNDFYAFAFTDNFFSAGVKAEAGLSISGEKNVGIQFPDIANFDFSVMFTPFLELSPFAVIRTPQLKRISGPTFKLNTEAFSVDLLPNIHNVNCDKRANKLKVKASMDGANTCFLDAKESGIALFREGDEKPFAYQPIMYSAPVSSRRTAPANDIEFDIQDNEEYELYKYSRLENGEEALKKIEIGICSNSFHPHAVDLGLPSGLKWACCNVGATIPEEYGDLFAWGETSPISITGGGLHQNIGSDISGTSYDAAHVNWGGNWRMPTHAEQEELLDCCTWTWTIFNGVNGALITGPNGNSIFLPAAGFIDGVLCDFGEICAYWSSTRGCRWPDIPGASAYYMYSTSDNIKSWDDYDSTDGRSVRAVCP